MAEKDFGVAATPKPPYVAVIFTSRRRGAEDAGYWEMAVEMERLAAVQPGFLGLESARGEDGLGITVSYWRDEAAATAWKAVARHRAAQLLGRERWYDAYEVRIARVSRAYGFRCRSA